MSVHKSDSMRRRVNVMECTSTTPVGVQYGLQPFLGSIKPSCVRPRPLKVLFGPDKESMGPSVIALSVQKPLSRRMQEGREAKQNRRGATN